jgi:hypothetical protein
MTRNVFKFMHQNIHFADNAIQQSIDSPWYDPLYKVRYALDTIGDGLRKLR